jgi:hypothetical protein
MEAARRATVAGPHAPSLTRPHGSNRGMAKPKLNANRGKIGGGWSREFDDPIPLPKGKPLVTLRDAANYILKLPKAERELPEWQTAAKVLMLIGERGGDPMMARIGVMRALHRDKPDTKLAPRRKRAKAYKVIG